MVKVTKKSLKKYCEFWFDLGIGTKDSDLVRIVTSRCELDMVEIKEAYKTKYNDSLENMIKGNSASSDFSSPIL